MKRVIEPNYIVKQIFKRSDNTKLYICTKLFICYDGCIDCMTTRRKLLKFSLMENGRYQIGGRVRINETGIKRI